MKLQLIENICRRVVSLVLLTGICLLYSKGVSFPCTCLSCSFVGNTGPSRLQDIHLCLENNPCPDCHGHACITIKYRRYENLHIYLLGSGHAGCMARHKPDNTCQKTASLYDRRTETYRLLSGTVERHRLESGQAENPEGFFQGNLCITF